MRTTINNINAAIKDLGYELVKGNGYFYFWAIEATTPALYDSMVCTMQLTAFTIDDWRSTLVNKIEETAKR